MGERTRSFLVAGWAGVVLVAVLMAVLRGRPEYAPAAVFGAIGVAMAVWTSRSSSRAALVTSFVLGVLWTLQFVAYAIAGAMKEGFEADVFAVDVFAVVVGGLILAGAVRGLTARRRTREPAHA